MKKKPHPECWLCGHALPPKHHVVRVTLSNDWEHGFKAMASPLQPCDAAGIVVNVPTKDVLQKRAESYNQVLRAALSRLGGVTNKPPSVIIGEAEKKRQEVAAQTPSREEILAKWRGGALSTTPRVDVATPPPTEGKPAEDDFWPPVFLFLAVCELCATELKPFFDSLKLNAKKRPFHCQVAHKRKKERLAKHRPAQDTPPRKTDLSQAGKHCGYQNCIQPSRDDDGE